jgi:hypothetical protein
MLRLLLLIVLAVLLFSSSARAQGTYRAVGEGGVSCGTWTAERANNPAELYWLSESAWVLGFLSGVGYEGAGDVDPLRGVDAKGVEAWLDNYCRTHPLQTLVDAAGTFVIEHPNEAEARPDRSR